MPHKEINMKNRIYIYYDDLDKVDDYKYYIGKKSYKDLVFYFARYILKKSMDMISL